MAKIILNENKISDWPIIYMIYGFFVKRLNQLFEISGLSGPF
jgi:hypothetical protein